MEASIRRRKLTPDIVGVLARLGPPLAIFLLTGPIVAGLAGTLLPAFGYLPVLGGTEPTLAYFTEMFAQPGIFRSCLISIGAGLVTAAISLCAVMGFLAGWGGTPLFSRIQHIVSPLLSVPHAAAAFGLAFLIAPSGMLLRLISPEVTGWERPPDLLIVNDPWGGSMMAGLIVKEIPFLLLVSLAALPQLKVQPTRMLSAALGYGRISGFLITLWPQLYRQIRLAVFAVIAFSSSVVDVASILGPTTPAPLAVRLVEWMSDPDLRMRFPASAGAILQLGVTGTALLIWILIERAGRLVVRFLGMKGIRLRHDRTISYVAMGTMLISATVIFAGLATLVLWSVAGLWRFPDAFPASLTLQYWLQTLPRIADPLATTFIVAFSSAAIATFLAVLCLVREDRTGTGNSNGALWLLYIPLIVPQTAFLFGLQFLFIAIYSDATLPALIFTHLIFVLPYVFLSLADPWRAFDRRYDSVAAGLGKSRWTTLVQIRLPMLLRAILTAWALGFAVSVGQYLPTVLIGAGRLTTITTEAVALASGGNRRIIGIYTVFQMMLPLAAFLIATGAPALIFRNRSAMRV